MSTEYKIKCESAGVIVNLTLTDSIIPFPGYDAWECDDETLWGLPKGKSSWGKDALNLFGFGAEPVATLDGFTKATTVGDTGSGDKAYPDGTFQGGAFGWTCIAKT
jgi:hypothetical protein